MTLDSTSPSVPVSSEQSTADLPAKQASYPQQRRRGRTQPGGRRHITLRTTHVSEVDRWAVARGCGRSDALDELLAFALQHIDGRAAGGLGDVVEGIDNLRDTICGLDGRLLRLELILDELGHVAMASPLLLTHWMTEAGTGEGRGDTETPEDHEERILETILEAGAIQWDYRRRIAVPTPEEAAMDQAPDLAEDDLPDEEFDGRITGDPDEDDQGLADAPQDEQPDSETPDDGDAPAADPDEAAAWAELEREDDDDLDGV